VIRDATPDDARAIAEVHVASWRVAYEGLMPREVIESRTVEVRERMWHSVVADEEDVRVLVLEEGGAVCGFASVGAVRDPDLDRQRIGELYGLYLDPDVWGGGLGRKLHDDALAALRALGFTEAALWVLDTNVRARRFYEAAGWRTDGAEKGEAHLGPINEVRYRLTL